MQDEVVVERAVTIAAPQRVVFDFVTEYSNDPQWRAEVRRMEFSKPLEIGVIIVEHAEFQGLPLVTRTALTEREVPCSATVETPADEANHLVSVRTVAAINDTKSHFTYRLAFERETLRAVIAELPPAAEMSAWYGTVMESYLETLKGILKGC